jgi:hypothetical protein
VNVRDSIKNGRPVSVQGESTATVARIAPGEPLVISVEKADLMGRVEWAMMHGGRDITARKSIEWGEVQKEGKPDPSIRYKFDATIWDRDVYTMNKMFNFDAKGNIISTEDVAGFPQKTQTIRSPSRWATVRTTSSSNILSVKIGKCLPCCSTAAMGTTTGTFFETATIAGQLSS